jgi:hypothetical protein
MSTIMSTRTLHKVPSDNDNDGGEIMSDTYALKPRDRAIRSQMFRTFRHQQHQGQSADGPRKYVEFSGAEDERFSHNIPRISRVRQHNRQLVSVTEATRRLSAVLTFCSTKSLPSGPERAAHFARERPQSSVGQCYNDRREIISNAYALKRPEDAFSFHLLHFPHISAAREHNRQLVRVLL